MHFILRDLDKVVTVPHTAHVYELNILYLLLSMFHLLSCIKNNLEAKLSAPGCNEPSKIEMYLLHLWV